MFMKRERILSIDVGTSSLKAAVFDGTTQLIAAKSVNYPLLYNHPGWVEQDPQEVLAALHRAIKEVVTGLEDQPQVIVLSTAMHALMAVDPDNRPITPFITWADQRARIKAEQLRSEALGLEFYLRTGTPIHAMSPLLKLAWFKENQPELFAQAHRWVDLKSYVLFTLLGEWVVDESIASATGLYNLRERDWDPKLLAWAGIAYNQLPRLVKTTEKLGVVKPDLAQLLGLPKNTRVIAGASDGALANLGVGAVKPGAFALSVGTSGAVRGMVREPKLDPKGRLFCYVVDSDHYILGGPINNGGILLRWLKETFFSELITKDSIYSETDFYNALNQEVASIAPGAEGLFCLPFLTGERAPLWREDVSGSFWGLKLTHRRAHFLRAVLEGISYQLLSVVDLLEEQTGGSLEIRATGGFTQSSVWSNILTQVLGVPLGIPEHTQGSALGGAFLAWYALGQLETLEECEHLVPVKSFLQPETAVRERYREAYALYQELVGLGLQVFPKLNDLAMKGRVQ